MPTSAACHKIAGLCWFVLVMIEKQRDLVIHVIHQYSPLPYGKTCPRPQVTCKTETQLSVAARVGSILFFSHIDDVGRLGAVVGRSGEN